jgi:ABC-type transporter MlaC component
MMSTQSPKNEALNRISIIVDKVFEDSEVYREEVNKDRFLQSFSNQMNNGLSPEYLSSITGDELTRMVRQLMATELLGTLLDGLTPEQLEVFNDAIERR